MSMVNRMVKEFKFGQMVLCMKAIGRMANRMERVVSLAQTVQYTKVTGKMVWLMDLEFLITRMGPHMKVNG